MKPKSSLKALCFRRLFLSSCLLMAAGTAHAQSTYFWDADGEATEETGGLGVWDATSPFWRTDSATGPLVQWPNTADPETQTFTAIAQFAGTAAVVRLNNDSENININRMVFATTGYEIEGPISGTASLNLSGTGPVIDVGTSITAFISANVSGSTGLTKTGAGTLSFSGENSYTGVTTVGSSSATGGIVNVSGDQSAATGGWNINHNSIVNFLEDSKVVVGTSRNISLANSTSTTNVAFNVFGSVTTSTNSQLNVRGRRILNLESGAEWLQRGPLNIQPQNTTYSATVSVKTGATFTYAGSNNITLARASTGNSGSATLNISGGTFITSRAISNAASGAGSGSTNLNLSNGGTLRLSADIPSLLLQGATPRPFNVTTGTGGSTIDTNAFNTAIALPIAGAGGLTKAGDGTLTLDAANSFTGPTEVAAGRLKLGPSGVLTTSSAITVRAGATLDVVDLPTFAPDAVQPITLGINAEGAGASGVIQAANLDLTTAVINVDITGTPDDPVYVLATYSGTLTGSATAVVTTPPAGYTLDFAYQGNKIALTNGAPAGFANWRTVNSTTGGLTADHDNDGVPNGIEYFLNGAAVSSTGNTTLPTIERIGNTLSITWTRAADYPGLYGVDFRVETSETLEGNWITAPVGVNLSLVGNQVRYTFPVGNRSFARLVVTGP